ncbi:purine-cytosine permease [Xylariales sp. PMI_506]|nr:purine-cytosine permease [Xylariales sp. PMI_506]
MDPLNGNEKHPDTTEIDSESQTATAEVVKYGFWEKTRGWIRTIGAEEFGIERIPEEERTNQPPRDLCTIFFAANCNAATLATGFLGTTLYGLGWWDSFLCILFFNLAGCFFPSFAAMMGPKLGLRTMILPRYSYGWWPAKILAFLNVVNQLGWGIVNGISGASVLYDVGDGNLPLSVSVLIIGLVAIVFGLLGYRMLHIYDRYSWFVMFVCFIIVAGFGAPHFLNVPMGSGPVEASNVLSFGTAIIGFQVAWLPVGADYGVYMKDTISTKTTFGWAYAGLFSSQLLLELLGAAIGTLSISDNPIFVEAYADRGVGGLIGAVFEGRGAGVRGFGRFVEVLIGFSTAAVITTNIYSLGLSVQMISTKLLIIPRFVWSLLGSIVFLACAIAGREYLEEVMEDFLLICAYWIVPFCTVIILEHFIWRRDFNYDTTAYNDPTKLPYGFAAFTTFIISTMLSIICMSQTWWIGPIAAAIGGSEYGTDISWILSICADIIIYIPLRVLERRKWGV